MTQAILERPKPRAVLLAHWEDFFQSPIECPKPVPGTDFDEFLERFGAAIPRGTPWWMLDPGEGISIPLP